MPSRSACAFSARVQNDTTTIRLLGYQVRLDRGTAVRLGPQLVGLVRSGGARVLVLDLRNVGLITAAGMRLLLKLRKQMRAFGGRVRLQHLTPEVAEVFEVTKVGRLFGLPARPADRWFYARGETLVGPVSTAELRRLVHQRLVASNATVWRARCLLPVQVARALGHTS